MKSGPILQLSEQQGNIKALYRASKAAYSLNLFGESKDLLMQALKLDKVHQESRTHLTRVNERLTEQKTGPTIRIWQHARNSPPPSSGTSRRGPNS